MQVPLLNTSLFDLNVGFQGWFSGLEFTKCLYKPGPVVQSAVSLTADPGVECVIPAWYHTFLEIDNEIISMVILLSADSRRVVDSFKQKYKCWNNKGIK